MASNIMKYPLARVAKRGFAAQSAVKPAEAPSAPDVSCTVLPNKLLVSTLDLNGPLSRVSVVFRVGPKNETPRNMGVTHIIRSMTGFSTEKCTGFAIVRNLQQNGIHFTCTGDRELTGFHVVGTRNKINCALRYLAAVTSSPAFKRWEVKDNLPRVLYEIGSLSPQARTVDILHRAAYRTGLGNSLFIKKDFVGTHTPEMLHTFYKEGFTSNRATVTGVNVNHNEMLEFAKSLELSMNDPLEGNSTYYGGDVRKEKNSYFAHVAVATEGVGVKDVKDVLTYSVLQHAYGVRPVISWGGSPSPLYKAVHPVASEAGISCLNINYNDTGLFGFMLSSFAENAGKAVEAAVKVLKSASVTEDDVKRGKALLKMNILSSCESLLNISDDLGIQSLYGGVIIPAPVLADAVDKVTSSDVKAAASKVASGKLSLGGFGNLTEVPYLEN